jgi:nonsense-mediated mRNA decay protein 3
MATVHGTKPSIACCLCGKPTTDAVDGRCLACLAATVDVTEGIDREYEVEMCKTCAQEDVYRWFRNPQWVLLEPESAELLSLCMRRIRGLKAVRLVNAGWIWTEPHSRLLKVKLTVAKDVLSGHTIQQSFVVDFAVRTRNCDKCNKAAAKQDAWLAKVQVRQRAEHPRTLLAMEQQMLKRSSEMGRAPPMEVKRTRDGLDFLFSRRQHAQRFVSLLHALAPCRSKASRYHNTHSNSNSLPPTAALSLCVTCIHRAPRTPHPTRTVPARTRLLVTVAVGYSPSTRSSLL